jgi:hypothetical protein
MKPILFVLGSLLMSLANGIAAEAKDNAANKTVIIDIPSDMPVPPSAEKVLPTHPFFNESPANEVMETIQELEDRIEKLDKRVSLLEKGKTE